MALPLEEPPAPELPLELELSPDLLDDALLEDLSDLPLAVFLADSYSERLSCPSLFLSYWVKFSASPETVRASSMLTAPLLSASALRKLGHSPAEDLLDDPDAPLEDPAAPDEPEEPEAPDDLEDSDDPAAPDDPEAEDPGVTEASPDPLESDDPALLLSEDLLLLSAANTDTETADNANANAVATADFIIPFMLNSPIKVTDPPGAAGAPGGSGVHLASAAAARPTAGTGTARAAGTSPAGARATRARAAAR